MSDKGFYLFNLDGVGFSIKLNKSKVIGKEDKDGEGRGGTCYCQSKTLF